MTLVALAVALALLQVPQQPPRDVRPNTGPATARISGVVTSAATGEPIRGAEIRLTGGTLPGGMPMGAVDDPQHWTPESRRIAAARPDQSGGFSIRVPPGGYFMTALEYLQPGQERERATLERLRRLARPIALVEGQTETATLTLTP